jgi:DNA-binding beta-propeller fold protein YncE
MKLRALTLIAAAAGTAAAAAPARGDDGDGHGRHGATVQLEHYAAPAGSGIVGPDSPASFDATLPSGRRITPAGDSTMVGELPLGSMLTPDGKYLIVSDDDERDNGAKATPFSTAKGSDRVDGGYRITVVRVADMQVVSHVTPPTNPVPHDQQKVAGVTQRDNLASTWLGVAIKDNGAAPPTAYISGGPNNTVYAYRVAPDGTLTPDPVPVISVPVPQDKSKPNYGMAAPGGLALSPDQSRLFVVENNGNTVTAVDTTTNTPIPGSDRPVGFFPYTGAVAADAGKLFVSNWGVADRNMGANYRKTGDATASGLGSPCIGGFSDPPCTFDAPNHLFANPATDPQRSSSVSVLDLAGNSRGAISLARPIDGVNIVGGTHPSALAVAHPGGGRWHSRGDDDYDEHRGEVLFVADANEDRVAVIDTRSERVIGSIVLPNPVARNVGGPALGLYPDALAVSKDQRTLYVAEAGLNAVAVFDVTDPREARYRGAIPTGWYPSSLQLTPDGKSLLITNAKGFGAPLPTPYPPAKGSKTPDVNLLFGSAQKVDLDQFDLRAGDAQVQRNTYRETSEGDARGLRAAERNVEHVIFVLRENKTYDSYLGNDSVLNARGADGDPSNARWDAFVPNTKKLAETFATGDRAYADSEESDAGHQYALAGTSTDYSQKTLLSRGTRALINVKNEDPEDYPLRGYLFNAAARQGVSYRDYGDMIRVSGYDEGQNPNGCLDDPANHGCPNGENSPGPADPFDITSPTKGFGGRYAEDVPALKVLGGHIDQNYPGWSLRITDQRREQEFERDYSRLLAQGRAPRFTFVWLPQDHTGNAGGQTIPPQFQVADNDAALGRLVSFISHSSIWRKTAILITEDDAQGETDHVSAHRTVTTVVSPWAKRGHVSHTLISTASVTKTVDELVGLAPSSIGDVLATDLRDFFTDKPDYTPYSPVAFTDPRTGVTAASRRIVALSSKLDTSGPDADSFRQAKLSGLAVEADRLAARRAHVSRRTYRAAQARLYDRALAVVRSEPVAGKDD